MNETMMFEKVFRDPIHHDIQVEHPIILELINSKEFQRLRRIKQLGTTSLIFHTAEHSRFGHSLGVYEITRQILNFFTRQYPKDLLGDYGWDDTERLVTLCAALLHDVGHGPYSHTFESIFKTNHELLTIDIITNEETEINQILKKVSSTFPFEVASVIQKNYPNQQVVQLISSQIDADRMDYLLRDAYFTGTEYGTFDLSRILRVIRPHKDGITFNASGMHAVEDYIVSRYQMYMQVYFHPVSRGMEVILDKLLKRAKELYLIRPNYFEKSSPLMVPFLKNNFNLEDYLDLDDGVLTTSFHMWSKSYDPVLSDLAKRFLNRKPFKSVAYTDETKKELDLMRELIEQQGYNTDYYTAEQSSFDLPYDFYKPSKENNKTQIELIQPDGSLIELSRTSDLVASLAGENKGDQRFYFPSEMLAIKSDTYTLFEDDMETFNNMIQNGAIKKTKEVNTHDN
ncbi:HD domain-containing protein [Vagococcus jeotgali]|uniref:HD domain-containing protein n=1 Tax=Vagococcus jeotgali TaxID=3109030 RepID=UPI002DDB54FA|nr:HD domain-containing protein [Vagococcus sp. B2T-5]